MSAWQHYQGGVVTSCDAGLADHAVNIVGFGEDAGLAYWIVRNSWGPDWGEDGYMRVEFGTNQCNLKTEPTTALVGSADLVPMLV
jgi:cysteine peptidase B